MPSDLKQKTLLTVHLSTGCKKTDCLAVEAAAKAEGCLPVFSLKTMTVTLPTGSDVNVALNVHKREREYTINSIDSPFSAIYESTDPHYLTHTHTHTHKELVLMKY